MAATLTEFYIKIGQTIIILIILSYFLFRRYHDRITGFNWFISLFSLIVLQSLIEIAIFFPTQNGKIDSNSTLQEIHMIPSGLALFGLFLYLEYIRNEKPNTFLLGFASVLLGGYIAVYIIELSFGLETHLNPEYRTSRVFLNILQAFVLAEAFYVFIQDVRKVEYKKLRRISLMMAIAFGIGFVFATLKIFERWTIQLNPRLQFYGAIPFSITFGILAIAFIANPFYVYLLPTKINKILIFNDAGILLYSVRIGAEEPELSQDTLFSGIITALRSLISETTGAKTDLRKISFRDKKLLVVENKERTVSTIIVCDSDSLILQTAARHFTERFYDRFSQVLEKFDGAVSKFRETSDIVRRVFPFVPPEELIED
ncbi:MAG: hypothetical protein KAS63_09180 [Candidatus Heimdallarchaeota archaeon]|nr:hypothetical protein [Candidatus Heimdallarchaeota archaeon]MCK4955522.1 hypothetical protein [Candidatus Heimdallarchaeota archaeon]